MKSFHGSAVVRSAALLTTPDVSAQTRASQAAGSRSDVYHVHFTKAVPA